MISISPRARRDIRELQRHFLDKGRPEAVENLLAAVREASGIIGRDQDAGIASPRPYPQLERRRIAWVKVHRYWIGYRQDPKPTIAAVFYDTADIPRRL